MGKSRIVFCFVVGAVFLYLVRSKPAGAGRTRAEETTQYVEGVLVEGNGATKGTYRCMEGHWRMVDDKPVFICG
jgi:hypothetical protein